jgi:hypothetical protein
MVLPDYGRPPAMAAQATFEFTQTPPVHASALPPWTEQVP